MAQVDLSIIPGKSPYTPNMSPGESVYCGLHPGPENTCTAGTGLSQPPRHQQHFPFLAVKYCENFQGELNVEKTAWEALITLRACDSQTRTML